MGEGGGWVGDVVRVVTCAHSSMQFVHFDSPDDQPSARWCDSCSGGNDDDDDFTKAKSGSHNVVP